MSIIESKEKYTFGVTLLATILAFTAFKSDLKAVEVYLGFAHVDLLTLFVTFAILLTSSTYFFALDSLRKGNSMENVKFLNILFVLGNSLYFLGLIFPLMVFMLWGVTRIIQSFPETHIDDLPIGAMLSLAIIQTFAAIYLVVKYVFAKETSMNEERLRTIDQARQSRLEQVERLYRDGIYSAMIMEAYKVLELAIKEKLERQGVKFTGYSSLELLNLAKRQEILDSERMEAMSEVRNLRNKVAHSVIGTSRPDADLVMNSVKQILEKLDSKE